MERPEREEEEEKKRRNSGGRPSEWRRKEPSVRESRTHHAESHGLGAAVEQIEGDTQRRAKLPAE